jgi:aminoglycoside/choline kinase family phosphotransferase
MCIAKIRAHMRQSQGGPNFGNAVTKAWDKIWQTILFSFLSHDTLRVYGEYNDKNIMWGISNACKCGHSVFQNAMQVFILWKHSSNYITNMGKGFYV